MKSRGNTTYRMGVSALFAERAGAGGKSPADRLKFRDGDCPKQYQKDPLSDKVRKVRCDGSGLRVRGELRAICIGCDRLVAKEARP